MIKREIILNKKTRKATNAELFDFGIEGENLQENIIFSFEDEFVNGQARVEIEFQDGTKNYIEVAKNEETYLLPIKSIITKKGLHHLELVITEGTSQENIPIFKSEKISFIIREAINAVGEAPDEYASWVDILNTLISQVNNKLTDLQNKVDTGYFNGKDAVINGYNTLEIIAGQNIILEQNDNVLTISAVGVAPYPDNVLETSDGDIFMTSDDAYFVVKESE